MKAAFFVYCVGFITPVLIAFVVKIVAAKRASTLKMVSIYGYAYFIYLIAAILAIIPSEIIQWIVLIYAGGTSIVHLSVCINKEIDEVSKANLEYRN